MSLFKGQFPGATLIVCAVVPPGAAAIVGVSEGETASRTPVETPAQESVAPAQAEPEPAAPLAAKPATPHKDRWVANGGRPSELALNLIRRKKGATAEEIMEATGWKAQTLYEHVRKVRRSGENVTSVRSPDGKMHYRLES